MARIISLKDAVNHFLQHLTHQQLGNVIGVSKDQVYKYSTGYTKTCSDKVVNSFYDNCEIEGEKVLIDFFKDEAEYLSLRQLKTTSKSTQK